MQGSVVDGLIDQTETGKKDKGGKFGANVSVVGIEANLSSGSAFETKQRLSITAAAQFQQLYSLLNQQESIQQLDAFDEDIWEQLRRREILEVEATIRLPESYTTIRLADSALPLLSVMDALGQDAFPDAQTKQQFDAMVRISKLTEDKPVPLVFEASDTPGYGFAAHLPKQYLRCELSELQGEATVFGTVQRIIPKGQQQELFNLLPMMSVPNTTVAQRQQMLKDLADKGMAEILHGPAMLITPLAVYR